LVSRLNINARKQAALLRACRLAGGRSKLARQISASVSQISNWVNRGDTIPYHYALLIAKATSNVINIGQLCPEMHHANQLLTQQTTINQVSLRDICYCENRLQVYAKSKFLKNPDLTLLTQPILVDTDYQLLAFANRLYAHQQAKSITVPAIVVDIGYHLQTQTPIDSVTRLCPVSERVSVGEIIQQRSGNRRGRPLKNPKMRKNIPNFKGRSLDVIARLVGFGNRVTYNQAKQVLTQGCYALIQALDSKQLSISLAAKLIKLEPMQQQALLAQDKKVICRQIKKMRSLNYLSNAAPFIAQQQNVDIVKIYHWLLQQGAPVHLAQKQQGGYELVWQQEK